MTKGIIEYLMIQPNEDGRCVQFMTREDLDDFLEEMGEVTTNYEFLTLDDVAFSNKDNPMNWKHYTGKSGNDFECMIVKIDKVIEPKVKAVAWQIEEY